MGATQQRIATLQSITIGSQEVLNVPTGLRNPEGATLLATGWSVSGALRIIGQTTIGVIPESALIVWNPTNEEVTEEVKCWYHHSIEESALIVTVPQVSAEIPPTYMDQNMLDAVALVAGTLQSNIDALDPALGEMYQRDNAVATSIALLDEWVKIANFTQGNLKGVTFNSNALRSSKAVLHLMQYSISASAAAINKYFEFAIFVDGLIDQQTISKRYFSSSDTGSVSGCGLASVQTGWDIDLRVRNNTDATDITIVHANMIIHSV